MDKTGHVEQTFRILHVLRAPVGGLFRHVIDLTKEQIARGHHVGLITDSTTGGDNATEILNQLKPSLTLGLMRIPMSRQPSPLDLLTTLKIHRHARHLGIDVMHGHGAKGGLYARLPWFGSKSAIRAYTPHGGSFSVTIPYGLQHLYMSVERWLERFTDAYLFESAFVAGRFKSYIGETRAVTRVVPNGISAAEFSRVEPLPDAADLLFVGELRSLKGIDLLLDAIIELDKVHGQKVRVVFVGNGPDRERFIARVKALGLESQATFLGAMPAREAFKHGRILVLPSRSESLPYVILEAAGAQLPIVATDVGDIGNILAVHRDGLVPPNDPASLQMALHRMLIKTPEELQQETLELSAFVASRYSITNMVDAVLAVYRETIDRKTTLQKCSNPSFALRS